MTKNFIIYKINNQCIVNKFLNSKILNYGEV